MPWRLVVFIVVFIVFLVFIMFNLDNRCDINFGFKVFNDIPVFLTVFSSFILGSLCTLPLIFRTGKKQKDVKTKSASSSSISAARERFFKEHAGSTDKDSGVSEDRPRSVF